MYLLLVQTSSHIKYYTTNYHWWEIDFCFQLVTLRKPRHQHFKQRQRSTPTIWAIFLTVSTMQRGMRCQTDRQTRKIFIFWKDIEILSYTISLFLSFLHPSPVPIWLYDASENDFRFSVPIAHDYDPALKAILGMRRNEIFGLTSFFLECSSSIAGSSIALSISSSYPTLDSFAGHGSCSCGRCFCERGWFGQLCQHPRKCNLTEEQSMSLCESADGTLCSGKGEYHCGSQMGSWLCHRLACEHWVPVQSAWVLIF